MDFEFTPEQVELRAELEGFVDERLPPWWGSGIFGEHQDGFIPATVEFCKEMAERGWLTMSWPSEYGGLDSDLWSQMVLREVMWGRGEPRGPQYMNLNYIGPMIMRFGSEEQKARHLPAMARGEVLWTQGFSEPGAGSDLASLSTRAEDRGDHFVVNGQKIWNSYAAAPADWCLLLVRTNPDAPKHRGISVLLVDMTTTGVTVRPIESMAGYGEINEIFFDDVVVPRENLVGEQDQGWPMIVFGLSFERTGIANHARALATIQRLVEYVRKTEVDGRPLAQDPHVRTAIARLYCDYRAARLTSYRIVSMVENGQDPQAEASIAWVYGTRAAQNAAVAGMEIIGPRAQLGTSEHTAPVSGLIAREWLETIPWSIVVGTVDIQRSIIAQRGLGMPKAS
ncbi:acyl-CoA dehydrogenase family protein [Pseudonocardia xishanensis]|uniref:Acyl-CoA dehydrogenase family protein n=1 Tax=Pseudonocardia xishanensis TaxID=630995 RepID=A0ABP8RYH1_9PSEU